MRPRKLKKIKKNLTKLKQKYSFQTPKIFFDKESLLFCEKLKVPITTFFKLTDGIIMCTTKCIYNTVKMKFMNAHLEIRSCKHSIKKDVKNLQEINDDEKNKNDSHTIKSDQTKDVKNLQEINDDEKNKNDSHTIKSDQTKDEDDAISEKKNNDSTQNISENEKNKEVEDNCDLCLIKHLKHNNRKNYILACTPKSLKKYSGLHKIPFLLIKRGPVLELDISGMEK